MQEVEQKRIFFKMRSKKLDHNMNTTSKWKPPARRTWGGEPATNSAPQRRQLCQTAGCSLPASLPPSRSASRPARGGWVAAGLRPLRLIGRRRRRRARAAQCGAPGSPDGRSGAERGELGAPWAGARAAPACRPEAVRAVPRGLNASAMAPPAGNGTAPCGAVSVGFPLAMMVAGLAGNALALLLVSRAYRRKENRRKRAFLLCLGALALTDLAGQLVTSPVVVAVYRAGRDWGRVDPSRRLCAFFGLCMTAFGLCPLLIASAMAVERALATRAPHCYAGRLGTRAAKRVLLGVWLAGLAFALLPLAGVGRYALQWPGTWCFIGTGPQEGGGGGGGGGRTGSLVFAALFAGLGLSSLAVTVACNVATIAALVGRCRAKSSKSRSRRQWGRIATETLIQLLGIMCVLLACWSPLLIIMLQVTFSPVSMKQCEMACNQTQSTELDKECNFFLTAIRLASLNQILDPWVYLLFRKILLQKVCQVANAISCHSKDRWKGRHIILSDKIRHTTVA
uniref:prostaglandin E2 receptor EP3 subtype n=1 Tax=Euleptes europaea TaxID=460621 RepID=UPI0025417646|nr:prostaglandin E2 receptor EP3 subtype [Euleptes europaea]